jgi:hypothetical protein
MWAALRPKGSFLASGEHSRLVETSPVEKLQGGQHRVTPDSGQLVTDALLADMEGKGFLAPNDVALLKAWHPIQAGDYVEGALAMGPLSPASLGLPEDWQGPGSPLADVLPTGRRYGSRSVRGSPIRINVGYSWGKIVDSQGYTWLPDQIYEPGTYGYIGQSQLRRPQQMLPSVDIQGTTNDELFRTGRTQLARYLVAVPNGTYDVGLHFACLIKGRLWHPTIDVRVEGETVVDGLDARQLGRLSATSQRCKSVQVADGALDVELSQSDVALCGVEIV